MRLRDRVVLILFLVGGLTRARTEGFSCFQIIARNPLANFRMVNFVLPIPINDAPGEVVNGVFRRTVISNVDICRELKIAGGKHNFPHILDRGNVFLQMFAYLINFMTDIGSGGTDHEIYRRDDPISWRSAKIFDFSGENAKSIWVASYHCERYGLGCPYPRALVSQGHRIGILRSFHCLISFPRLQSGESGIDRENDETSSLPKYLLRSWAF